MNRALPLVIAAMFCIVVLGAGHGVAPIGLVLMIGWPVWGVPNAIATLGIALLFSAAMTRSAETRRFFAVAGLAASIVALALFAWLSEAVFWVSAIPYAMFSARLLWHLRNRVDRPADAE